MKSLESGQLKKDRFGRMFISGKKSIKSIGQKESTKESTQNTQNTTIRLFSSNQTNNSCNKNGRKNSGERNVLSFNQSSFNQSSGNDSQKQYQSHHPLGGKDTFVRNIETRDFDYSNIRQAKVTEYQSQDVNKVYKQISEFYDDECADSISSYSKMDLNQDATLDKEG